MIIAAVVFGPIAGLAARRVETRLLAPHIRKEIVNGGGENEG